MLHRGLKIFACTSLILACQSPPRPPVQTPDAGAATTGIEIRLDRTEYAPGGPIGMTIVNHDQVQYAFNPCTRTLEQSSGGQWQPVEEPRRMCTMEAWLLDPGATREADTELPASLSSGEYRVLIAFSRQTEGGSAVEGRSPPFQVR